MIIRKENSFSWLRAAGVVVLVLSGSCVACKTTKSPDQSSSVQAADSVNYQPHALPRGPDMNPNNISVSSGDAVKGVNNDSALSGLPDSCKEKDWSYARTKLSCPPGRAINGITNEVEPAGITTLTASCDPAIIPTPQLTCERRGKDWKYIELVESKFNNPFDCGQGWYVAGVSFVELASTQGLKSILCIRQAEPRDSKACYWVDVPRFSSVSDRLMRCGANEFMRGIETEPVQSRSCWNGKRKDDRENLRCDMVSKFLCCG
jgi:hypothetical protein